MGKILCKDSRKAKTRRDGGLHVVFPASRSQASLRYCGFSAWAFRRGQGGLFARVTLRTYRMNIVSLSVFRDSGVFDFAEL
jgi:hypothetical protein